MKRRLTKVDKMKIDVKLPVEFEQKWKQLRAFVKDDQILALAVVDLLWEKYGDDVCQNERLRASLANRLKDCKARLQNIE